MALKSDTSIMAEFARQYEVGVVKSTMMHTKFAVRTAAWVSNLGRLRSYQVIFSRRAGSNVTLSSISNLSKLPISL